MTPAAAGALSALAVLAALHGAAWRAAVRLPSGAQVHRPRPDGRGSCPRWVEDAACMLGLHGDPAATRLALRLALAGGALAVAVVVSPAGGILVVVACLAAPHLLRPALQRRRLRERDRDLPGAWERMASAIRSGAGPAAALVEVAEEQEGPLGEELCAVAAAVAHGEDLDSALQRWASHPRSSPDVVLAAAALGLGAEAGGQVARAVDAVAATLRERRELHAEVHALATQARSSAWILAAAPVVFAALVATVEPGALRFLFTTPVGLACLVAGLALDALGVTWMGRIVRAAS